MVIFNSLSVAKGILTQRRRGAKSQSSKINWENYLLITLKFFAPSRLCAFALKTNLIKSDISVKICYKF